MTSKAFSKIALSFPQTEEAPHFDRKAYRVTGKRIFATLHETSGSVNLKLSTIDQSVFSSYPKGNIYPVNNKWGLQGWTTFEIKHLDEAVIREALMSAYNDVMQPKPKRKR